MSNSVNVEGSGATENSSNSAGLDISLDAIPQASTSVESLPTGAPSTNTEGSTPPQNVVDPTIQEQDRSQYIPRDRFDQVNNQARTLEEQNLNLQTQLNNYQLQALLNQNQPSLDAQRAQQLTGMVAPQAQQYAPQAQPQELDYAEWQRKIEANGAEGLKDFVLEVVQPLAHQLMGQVNTRLQPVQMSFVDSARTRYEQSKVNDPSFKQIQPLFQNALDQVIANNPSISLNTQTLGLIEQAARLQAARQGVIPMQQQQVPFTETPNAGRQVASTANTISSDEEAIMRGFGMTPAQWNASKARITNG